MHPSCCKLAAKPRNSAEHMQLCGLWARIAALAAPKQKAMTGALQQTTNAASALFGGPRTHKHYNSHVQHSKPVHYSAA